MKLVPLEDFTQGYIEVETIVPGPMKGTKFLKLVKYQLDKESHDALKRAFDRLELTGSCKGLVSFIKDTGLPVSEVCLDHTRNVWFNVKRGNSRGNLTIICPGRTNYHHEFIVSKMYLPLVREVHLSPWQEGTWV